jgi:glycolate oxidase iron-sulfur subunit
MTSADTAGRGGYAALDPCVHCGFCLPACPTYLATGDENDSPRGRIVLMRALEAGELPPTDPAVRRHLDACLGCRGCEPACPSGVGYGRALEEARADLARANGLSWPVRGILGIFRHELLWRPLLTLLRWFRLTGLPGRLAGWGRVGFGMGMVAGEADGRIGGWADGRVGGWTDGRVGGWTDRRIGGWTDGRIGGWADGRIGGWTDGRDGGQPRSAQTREGLDSHHPPIRPSANPPHHPPARLALFRGCVTDTLLRELNDATVAVLRASGHEIVEVPGQSCCGALHAHAGAREDARALARRNLDAFLAADADCIVTNSAGCGALLREYHHLLDDPRAAELASRVRDVSEILAAGPLPPMGRLDLDIAYDPPCHLQHAQGVHDAPLAVLRAVPGLRVHLLPGHDHCCGGAGIYGVLHPELSRQVLDAKLEAIRLAHPPIAMVVTGNPGCIMQIGAGLRASGMGIPVVHPVQVVAGAMGGERGAGSGEQ